MKLSVVAAHYRGRRVFFHDFTNIRYAVVNQNEDEKVKEVLLGATVEERAQVIRWLSFFNSEWAAAFAAAAGYLLGLVPYNKKMLEEKMAYLDKCIGVAEARLRDYTYLATESISLADLFAASIVGFAQTLIYGQDWRVKHPVLFRWFNTVAAHPVIANCVDQSKFLKESKQYVAPKKEKAKKEPAAPKPKAAAPAKEEEAKPAETPKKPKHPLEALGRATFSLEDWKRKYSNEDTRPVALPWFWEHYNPEEFSIWRVDYKYNDELTMTFMSNNLVGGFFNRLSASVKYMFGSLVVYGENNNNGIIGAVMVRGQEFAPAFDVAPDWESYAYTKLDPTKEEDKEFINNMWAWDKPVVVNGESKEIVDGKVLK